MTAQQVVARFERVFSTQIRHSHSTVETELMKNNFYACIKNKNERKIRSPTLIAMTIISNERRLISTSSFIQK